MNGVTNFPSCYDVCGILCTASLDLFLVRCDNQGGSCSWTSSSAENILYHRKGCVLLNFTFLRPFEISELASRHLYRLWNRHWYRHCKNVLPWEILKNRIFTLYIVFSYGISTTLPKIVISLRFRIHPSKGVHWCFRKRLFELSEGLFWKNNSIKNFCILPRKTFLESFLSMLVGPRPFRAVFL